MRDNWIFLVFQVKAVVLDPDNEFNVDRTLTKDDVQKLIMVRFYIFFLDLFGICLYFFIQIYKIFLLSMRISIVYGKCQVKNWVSSSYYGVLVYKISYDFSDVKF